MRNVCSSMALARLGLAVVLTLPPTAWSYPAFQRLPYVSDAAPFCADCHSSVSESYHPALPAEASKNQGYTIKHSKALEEGTGGFKVLEPTQRQQLLDQTKKIDEHSSVQLEASASTVAPGGTLTVTVTTQGGMGPVVGGMLVDEPLRYQARPIQGNGWFIAAPPEIIGSDGTPQRKWLERRINKQETNLNFALVYDIASAPAKSTYATARVSYRLKAPSTPGTSPMTAAFLYGTGDANEMQSGKYEDPPGGGTAPSGRIQCSTTLTVCVQ